MDRPLAKSQVRVADSLLADGRIGSVSRIDDSVIGQDEQLSMEAQQHLLRAGAGKVDASDLPGQQRIAGEEMIGNPEGEPARAVAGSAEDLQGEAAKRQAVAPGEVAIG